ncbi:bifunctional diaminohydroxyphosphoribosylaminopyrimidine deaminase/5-amino-6-(5-phosphoribosylamino)uracil reductase RibD [Ketogulonicigenium vulgare]|uniref:bifunctional diaminohydroxyphosphoribosylaminopyrimidine deaminase/5-amino-6-(5-phosphoribosylamino)uracil reductase RibD n=1 Tax=Ketogulonicigenium vulgare TaxID=92945 RepID=UPI00235A2D56|nr:bifunctional diaminohydroxyphosphoribosylaminopyrimidine deaminase/5-amino-6-(5-phosphoribosylamino)uracil reductase RibD [Ketogulonicigenium vulgare]
MTQTQDVQAIAAAAQRAVLAARAYQGATAPNPPVGCAILDSKGAVLAVAAHQKAGSAHAEALAIAACRAAGTYDQIDTFVVTLEPCNHHGQTAPCTDAILQTPARRVFIGARDPNPRVAGGGTARLRAAGLAVHDWQALGMAGTGIGADALIAPFRKRVLTGRPWITVKQVVDAGGSMIPPAGRKTFARQSSLELAHAMRRRAEVIVTGAGTVLADWPLFTVRHLPDFPDHRRALVVLDRRGRVPTRYLTDAQTRGFDARIATDLAEALHDPRATEVLVEAGPILTDAVLQTALWDQHVLIRVGADADTITTTYREASHVAA